jgi:hypothetical protein
VLGHGSTLPSSLSKKTLIIPTRCFTVSLFVIKIVKAATGATTFVRPVRVLVA